MTTIGTPFVASTTAPATEAGATEREKLTGVAKQFEAVFLRQMLAAARKVSFGDSMFSSQGMDTFRQMQDERFADIAADTGAFGLGKMIEAHLARFVGTAETTADAGQTENGAAETAAQQKASGNGI